MNKQLVFALALIACNAFGMHHDSSGHHDFKATSPIKKDKRARKQVLAQGHACLADALESKDVTTQRARRDSLNRLVEKGRNSKDIVRTLFTQENAE